MTALRSIFGNFGTALKVSIIPFLLATILTIAIFSAIGLGGTALSGGQTFNPERLFLSGSGIAISVLVFVALAIIWLVTFAVTAIAWHRSSLEGVSTPFIPQISRMPISKYVLRLFLISIVMFLIFVVIGLIFAALIASSAQIGTVGLILVGLLGFAVLVFITSIWFRMASSLPAIAVGKTAAFRSGWEQTSDISKPILGTVVCTIVFSLMLSAVQTPFAVVPALGFVVGVAINWINTMLGLSILTEIYRRTGHSTSTEIFE